MLNIICPKRKSYVRNAFLTEISCFAAYITDNNGLPLLADATPNKIADPFDYGAGFINPTQASDPGLIYDINASDYQK